MIALLAALNSLVWSLQIPDGGAAPDEQAHDAVALHFAQHGEMPRLGEPGFQIEHIEINAHDRTFPKFPYQPYATHPPGAYALSAAWIKAAGEVEGPSNFRWSRASQFLLAAVFVVLAFLTARAMFPRNAELWVATPALVALWPQVTYVFAYLNPDALAAVAGGAIACMWFVGARRQWPMKACVLLGAAVAVAFISKPTAWPMIALTVAVIATTMRGPSARTVAGRAAALIATVAVIAGPWMVNQALRYDGDVTGIFVQREAVAASGATPIDGPSNGVSYLELLTDYSWLPMTARGFVLSIPSHQTSLLQMAVLWLLIAGGLIGGTIALRNRLLPDDVTRGAHLVAVIALPFLALVASINAWRGDIVFQGQGRYLFPALLPAFAYLIAAFRLSVTRLFPSFAKLSVPALLAAACAIALWCVDVLRGAYPGGTQAAQWAAFAIPIAITLAAILALVVQPKRAASLDATV